MGPMSSFFGFIKGFITNANVRGVKKGLIVSPSNYSKQVLSCMTVVLHTMYLQGVACAMQHGAQQGIYSHGISWKIKLL